MNLIRFVGWIGVIMLVWWGTGRSQTWQSTSGPYRVNAPDLIAGRASGASNATVYVHDGTTIRRSTDGGNAWQATSSFSNSLGFACKPDAPSTVFVGNSGGVSKSTNGGDNWTSVVTLPTTGQLAIAVATAQSQIVLVGTEKSCGNASLKINYNHGQSGDWVDLNYFTGDVQTHVLAITTHPTNYQLMWVGGTSPSPCLTETYTYSYTNGVFFSTDAGGNWANAGTLSEDIVALTSYTNGGTTYVFAATSDPNDELFYTTQGTNTGASWTEVSWSNGLISDLKAVGSTLYASTANGIYKSTNNGSTWTTLCSGLYDKLDMKRLAADPQNANILFACSPKTIYKTTDGGTTWRDEATGITALVASAVAAKGDTSIALSPSYSGAHRNSGTAWHGVDLSCASDFRGVWAGFRYLSETFVFAGGYRQGSGGNTTASLWRSTDAGLEWVEVRSGTYTSGKYNGVVTDPANTNRVYVFGLRQNGVAYSNDNISVSNSAGESGSWERVSIPNNSASTICAVSDMVIDPTGAGTYSEIVYAAIYDGTDKGIWKSTDHAVTWTKLTHTLVNNKAIRALGLNPNTPSVLYAAGGSAGAWWMGKSTNGGTDWTTISTMTTQVIDIQMHPSFQSSANHVWVISNNGTTIHKTTDGGASAWTDITSGITSGATINSLSADLAKKGNVFAATTAGVFRRNETPLVPTGFSATVVNSHSSLTWSANAEADVFYQVWRYETTCQYYCPNKVCGSRQNETMLYQPTSPSYYDATALVQDCPGTYGFEGVYGYYVKAIDNGGNISGESAIKTLLKSGDSPEKQSGGGGEVPETFFLSANYPNPFNPSTHISYGLPSDVHVHLVVYDLLGREIATLINEAQTAGYKHFDFSASKLSSGVYMYKLTAGSFIEVKKMTLTK